MILNEQQGSLLQLKWDFKLNQLIDPGDRDVKRIMRRLTLAFLVMGFAWISVVAAQDVAVRSDHPDEYVVVVGDTLWDISGRFLVYPWQWPAIWQANPQIANPHLIYPGDLISLVYVDGQPQLRLSTTKRLSPAIRESRREAINTIPLDAIDEFLRFPRVFSAEQLETLPYVVANNEQRMNAVHGENTYVRGITGDVGDEFVIARLNFIYEQSTNRDGEKSVKNVRHSVRGESYPKRNEGAGFVWRTVQKWAGRPVEILGYELWEIARGRVIKAGDPAVVKILGGRREVNVGDYVLPIDSYVYDSHFYPRASDTIPSGMHVLSASESVYGIGHYGIVSLSAGARDGVQPGHIFSAFRPGEEVPDIVKYPIGTNKRLAARGDANVTLPDEYVGQVMVFRSFDKLSYGIVLEGKRPVREADWLRHPAERL